MGLSALARLEPSAEQRPVCCFRFFPRGALPLSDALDPRASAALASVVVPESHLGRAKLPCFPFMRAGLAYVFAGVGGPNTQSLLHVWREPEPSMLPNVYIDYGVAILAFVGSLQK